MAEYRTDGFFKEHPLPWRVSAADLVLDANGNVVGGDESFPDIVASLANDAGRVTEPPDDDAKELAQWHSKFPGQTAAEVRASVDTQFAELMAWRCQLKWRRAFPDKTPEEAMVALQHDQPTNKPDDTLRAALAVKAMELCWPGMQPIEETAQNAAALVNAMMNELNKPTP